MAGRRTDKTQAGINLGHETSAWPPLANLAAAMIAIIILVPVAQMLVQTGTLDRLGISGAGAEAVVTILLFGSLLGIALLALVLDGRLSGLAGPHMLPMAALGVMIGGVGTAMTVTLAAVAGPLNLGGAIGGGVGSLMLGTIVVLFQAATEEVYFRGWLQPALIRRWRANTGLLVAAAAFAALHVMGGARSGLTLANLFLGGLLFGVLALRTGGLAASIGAHFTWNWSEQILLGLDPNPGIGSFGAIVDLDLVGSPLWGGSPEGLNASLALGAVLLALLIPLFAWRPATLHGQPD